MEREKYEALRLENQLCFPLYACSREIIKRYKPFLEDLDLTYTQYIVMMVLWEKTSLNVKELGESLYLDSGTLTPLLKKLEAKGLVTRTRSGRDERQLILTITAKGQDLKKAAAKVPPQMAACTNLSAEEGMELYRILYKILGQAEK